MAGGGLNTNSGQRRGTSVFIFAWFVILAAMERLTIVDALCTFEGRCLPSLPALDMTCDCPKGMEHFSSISDIKIKVQDPKSSWPEETVYDTIQKKPMQGMEVVADETSESQKEGRSRLVLRVMNYTLPHHKIYTCLIVGRDNKLKSEDLTLNMIKDCPTTTTSTTTTTTTTTAAATTTTESHGPRWQLPVTPKEDDITRFAATAGNTKDGFSGVGLYVVVALSCVLLIVIVIVIIGFVRVRGRRKREKLDVEQDLDLRKTQQNRPNCCHPDNNNQRNGNCVISNSPTRKLIGQDHACAVHTSCQPCCQHQTEASFQGKGKEDLADLTPLLGPHCRQGCGQRHPPPRKSATTSEDEEDVQGRRGRLVEHYPRRSRSRDAPSRTPARHSRSCDELDQEEIPNNRRFKVHRYSFPRIVSAEDQTTDEEGWMSSGRRPRRQRQRFRVSADVHDQEPIHVTAARVQENDNAYQDWYLYPVTSPDDDLYGTTSEGEAVFVGPGQTLPRHDLQVDGEMAARYGQSPACRYAQQPRLPQGGRYPTVIAPSSSRHRHPSPTSPALHYGTTPTPTRHRSPHRSTRTLRHNLSHPQLYYLSDGGGGGGAGRAVYLLHDSDSAEVVLRPAAPPSARDRPLPPRRVRERNRRSRSLGSIHDEGRERPGSQDRGRLAQPETPAAPEGIRELSPLPGERGDYRAQMNVLSRVSSRPPPTPASPLNVPVGREPGAGPQHDTTQRKTLAANPRVETGRERRSRPRLRRQEELGQASDSSPSSRRHSISSTTDNDNPRLSTSRGRRGRHGPAEREAEINLRAIKADNETRRKRLVSVKVGNTAARPPVVCAADVGERQGGAPALRVLQRKESARGGGVPRREEGGRPRLLADVGVEVISLDSNGHCSHFTENNHSTSAKTPHPC